MVSAIKVKSGFRLAELDLDRRLADEASYLQRLRKLQIAMLELEQSYRVERRRGIIALEEWDASGNSSAIQRLIEKLDPAGCMSGRSAGRAPRSRGAITSGASGKGLRRRKPRISSVFVPTSATAMCRNRPKRAGNDAECVTGL